jgi:integrase
MNWRVTGSYNQAIRRACERAEVETWTANQLRHTAATEIRRQFGLEAAAAILGHRSLSTSEICAERDLSRGVEVAVAMG